MAYDDVTAVVVTFNSAHVLASCLDAVIAAGMAAIVVDNASTDSSAAIARQAGAQVISNARNEGFGRAMNRGVAAATTSYCLLLNPDVTFTPEAVARLRAEIVARPTAALAGPRLVGRDGHEAGLMTSPINPPVVKQPTGDVQDVALLSGAALLVRRDVFLAVGGFDPNIFLFWEDNDLCRRLRDSGHDILLVKSAPMTHVAGQSVTLVPGLIYRTRWHQAWSRFYAFRKHGIASDVSGWIWRFRAKHLWARLTNDTRRMGRYAGSRDGARAFQRGETALEKEGLPFEN